MARIFIAIRFSDAFKNVLVDAQHALQDRGVTGDYCSYGNLHMTLAFIGEHEDLLPAIRQAMSEVQFSPFTLTLHRLGMFPTRSGVIWAGVKESEPVTALANQVRERLAAHGVPLGSTLPFSPHISLVQHPSHIITDIVPEEASIRVERICVMRSERIKGVLTYTEVESQLG